MCSHKKKVKKLKKQVKQLRKVVYCLVPEKTKQRVSNIKKIKKDRIDWYEGKDGTILADLHGDPIVVKKGKKK